MARAGVAKLPSKLTLPSGAIVRLALGKSEGASVRVKGAPLFEEVVLAFASGHVDLTKSGGSIDVTSLPLRDFHVLRAVLIRSGIIAEEEISISCRNCEEKIEVRPCAALEIGPWVDGETDDPELDTTLPFGEPLDVPEVPLDRVRTARTVTFEDRTVGEARPLFVAAARERLVVDETLVRAMGIVALGAERDAGKIAEALAHCDDDAFDAVGDAFLESHYVARLGCVVFCDACGARNDVDAPYERESGGGGEREREREGGGGFPSFEGFAKRARAIAQPLMRDIPGEEVELVIEGGTPAVDDGGEPLLGSYVPPHPGESAMPTRAPVVTVYYKTFRAMWEEEGPYDWDDELFETIEHELEHHIAFLRGDDPMDDEERAVIANEAVRIVGKKEAGRRAWDEFGQSWRDFFIRTWPLWVLAVLALIFMLASQQ